MSFLALLWWSSLLFGAAALVWMAGLILARLWRERTDRKRAADEARVRSLFLEIMAGEADAEQRLSPYAERARLMAETLVEVIGLVRGAERERLIDGLARLGVAERLRLRLNRGGKAGRVAAAEALAAFPDVATVDALRASLGRSCDGDFRVAVLTALLDMEAAPPLQDMLIDLANRDLHDSLLYEPVIRRAAAATPMEALDVFLLSEAPSATRAVLADALGASGDYRAVEPLCRTAAAPELELRIASVRALGILGHPAAEEAVMTAFSDAAWEVRSAACESAGRIGLVRAAPMLVQALGDPAWWVRFRAGEALAMLGDKGIAGLRMAVAIDQDVVRRAASLALAERGLTETAA
ncbi:MAG: HEAT repeat domain-containing protein [Brevundimonas sp.]|uniref:HEAT repeat domain-containing protein n=1 Tax=Brevundimonas sp. TaxID=1871086 RepID=UPI00391BBBA2